jgi:putative two-component system response regulator
MAIGARPFPARTEHALRVGRTAAQLAEAIGWDSDEVERLQRAAPFHDVGKVVIPTPLLLKPGRFTRNQFEIVKRHAALGAQILSGSGSATLELAAEIALTHHERWDGNGYPRQLKAAQIPLSGRIVALADVFDALTHQRPYKQAWSLERACQQIEMLAGSHLDPYLVELFATLDRAALLAPIARRPGTRFLLTP